MKKTLLSILTVLVLLSFSGCKRENGKVLYLPEASSDYVFGITKPSPENDGFPTEPSHMDVIFGETRIQAMRGSYSWRVDGKDGESQYIIADGIHPLSAKEYMPCLSLEAVNSSDSYTAQLVFDAPPRKVTAKAWPVEAFEDQSIREEEAVVDAIEIDYADGRNSCDYTLHIKNENYIYRIIAEWEEDGEYGGSAEYCFYTCYSVPEIKSVGIEKGSDDILCAYPQKEDSEK